jgi:hypothetical protein
MTTDLYDVFTGERVRSEKARENNLIDNLIVLAEFGELRLARFDVTETRHLSCDIDREWTTQTDHSESAAASRSG